MDWYEFFYESFKNAPRGKMLDWFGGALDYEDIMKLSTKELRFLYAERHILAVLSKSKR